MVMAGLALIWGPIESYLAGWTDLLTLGLDLGHTDYWGISVKSKIAYNASKMCFLDATE